MPQPSTLAARCAALSTSIAQVIPDVSSFARRAREARHDLNQINHDLLILRTGLGIAQDDFSTSGSRLPTSLIDAVSQVLDSCDDTSERLHKMFLKLSCSNSPKDEWKSLKSGTLMINIRLDLEATRIVLDLSLDYLALFGQTDTVDSLINCYVTSLAASSDDLLKRTDIEEINVNQTARDRLSSLLQAVRLLRSCITAVAREGIATGAQLERRTTIPRPDSLEPSLGESRRSGRISPPPETRPVGPTSKKGIGAWLAGVPSHSMVIRVTEDSLHARPTSHSRLLPSRGTFYTDDGISSGRTLVAPESRLRKARSWCSEISTHSDIMMKGKPTRATIYSPTNTNSDVSIFHKNITSDKIAMTKGNRRNLDLDQRVGVDRILANVPPEATPIEVERILCEGANPMVAHAEYGYFFIRAAHEMSLDILLILVEYGADITRTAPEPNRYHSVMHAATSGRQLDTVKYLASIGHSIDATNAVGETPLHVAVRTSGAFGVTKFFVDMGADVNHETDDGETPLLMALTCTKLEGKERGMIIELLLAHGAEGEVSRGMEGARGNSKGLSILGLDKKSTDTLRSAKTDISHVSPPSITPVVPRCPFERMAIGRRAKDAN
ncbi:hypothetical protein P153DRAFT_23792 [Dothidotthia symphoricarpi CBS 119687]|uniref:Uncharacterized protein n=1 Tax=Dothidotthia symphoricarpi CBS 119687 TaxID=1392245 RepID=A0A6A6AFE0_9PLEO|nr:uncharacterized protein P153DRAFT_23792 [Dothidotthia symphoricarpi CBS 119687]KAF2129664.1 hypothetical protein P153DRAFT_23792 [Dothidotthia symphoricarpi CBS 119687]